MKIKRIHWFFVMLVIIAGLLWQRHLVMRATDSIIGKTDGRKTVADRVAQYGELTRERLRPYFQNAGVSYPAERIIFVGLKHEKQLEIWAANNNSKPIFVRSYPILGASGGAGPKLREGDLQIPEGLYRIESLNPNSSYHLSLRVNYPNEHDREQGAKDSRKNLGGDIMIHGNSYSIGCLAMGDEAAEDLFILAADVGVGKIDVILSPVDFRVRGLPDDMPTVPSWTDALYNSIRQELDELKKQS